MKFSVNAAFQIGKSEECEGMLDDNQQDERKMEYGSAMPALFSTGLADPRSYVGAPNPRRCITPSASIGRSRDQLGSVPRSERSLRSQTPLGQCGKYMEGMVVGLREGTRSLDVFDRDVSYRPGVVLLDSPRSVKACQSLGLAPKNFLRIPLKECIEQMKRDGEDVSDMAVCKMRYQALCEMRQKMLEAAVQKRQEVIASDSVREIYRDTSSDDNATSTLISREERRLQKIVEANTSRLRQQLLHRELLQRQREKEDERLERQRKTDEQAIKDQQRLLMEKSRQEEEAQALRNEARELERKRNQEAIEEKRRMYEQKDSQVKARIHRHQQAIEAMHEAQRQHNAERRRQMRQQAEANLGLKREKFKERWEAFEESRREYREKLKEIKAQRTAAAERKEEQIQAAINRCEDILRSKIQKTQDRESAAQQKLMDYQIERSKQVDEKRAYDEELEKHRKMIYIDAQMRQQERVTLLQSKIGHQEQHMHQVNEEKQQEFRVKHELMRQKELEKQLCVERSQRARAFRIAQLEDRVAVKKKRVETMREQQKSLLLRRRAHAEEIERSRVHIPGISPGPGDYLLVNPPAGPRWKIGLPASAMPLRVINRDSPAPGYDPSPGPCMYRPSLEHASDRVRTPKPFLLKHERWAEPSTTQQTPGPADYAGEIISQRL